MVRQIRQERFVPTLFHASKRQLHAAHMRQHIEMFFADLLTEIACYAVEQWIA